MKNTEYKLLAVRRVDNCGPDCPAVIENGNEFVIIGTKLSAEERAQVVKEAKVGIAADEDIVRIPLALIEEAMDKLLTHKA